MKLSAGQWAFFIYCFSFVLPVFTDNETLGYQAFILSFGNFFGYPFAAISWFANLFFVLAVLYNEKDVKSFFSILAVIFGLVVMAEPTIEVKDTGFPGQDILFIGYYVWLFSFVLMFIVQYSSYLNEKKSRRSKPAG